MSKQFDARELGTVLAALRYWQRNHMVIEADDLHDIASDGNGFQPLSEDEIGALCERLNASADPLAIPSAADLRKSRLADAGEDMLAALEVIADRLEEALDTHIYDAENGEEPDENCEYVRAIDSARAAIAKAKGEEIDGSNAKPNGDDILFRLVQMHTHTRDFFSPTWREASDYLIAKGKAVN